MSQVMIAACGGAMVARVRKTYPAEIIHAESSALRRRGRILAHGDLTIVELPPLASGQRSDARPVAGEDELVHATDITAELAFYVGADPARSAVLLAVPAPQIVVADRITAPGHRELIPDLLEPTSQLDESVHVETVDHPVVWHAAAWAFRRLGPHQFWVVGLPADQHGQSADSHGAPADRTSGRSAIHRGLRSIVEALEQQTR
ncbi:MAG: hypothetical protein ACOCYB_09480 [Alkalispirochaeta sp.]